MINPGIIGLLATFGYSEVPVAKKPVVGLFATGSELLDVSEPLQPGKIRNSNSHAISAQIPCALVASIMPATLSAISNGARHGILFKGGIHL